LTERLVISRYAAAFVVLLACQLAYIHNTFPSAEDYRRPPTKEPMSGKRGPDKPPLWRRRQLRQLGRNNLAWAGAEIERSRPVIRRRRR